MNDQSVAPRRRDDTTRDLGLSVAILAPRGRDAAVATALLDEVGVSSITIDSLDDLAAAIGGSIGVALATEEALIAADNGRLQEALARQPSWSDVPFIVLTNGKARHRSERSKALIDALQNGILLSRPMHAEELVRAVRSALKARARQYEARDRMRELQVREAQLHESEAKFHAIADSIDQMIWSTRPDGFHDYYNHRWYEFTGMPEGSTDGEAWADVFHPDDQDRTWARWRQSLESGEAYEIEYRLRHRSGDYRWVLGRAQPVRDAAGQITRWYGSCTDINRMKVAEEQLQLVLGEMNHRVKNSMAMVQSIVSQTLRQADSLESARLSIQSRIAVMAQAHDRLVKATWAETSITEVVEAALNPHSMSAGRFQLDGPDLSIGSKQALALTMALHELATNAAKYGALSSDAGHVRVHWRCDDGSESAGFHLCWKEQGGPPVEPPRRQGFGSRLIEQALAGYFDGTAELSYDPDGLRLDLEAPLAGLSRQE
ncbi:PAS domain S-box protein [Paracoccus liaowanqingii]|uniref:histidine kinase n=1 Tax=Paracoccus liaowanqingii TaxID=2560053 RepID=A0A4Z1CD84_9RHOB|nr:HWE histidine kinase domain-containing protein [Paracoccus liaowanqingii]TGN62194.1 PAS domain S-box protein [Paracoccus liaowanqingii]